MDGFSISSERIVAAGGAVGEVGSALSGEIEQMRELLDDIQVGWQSSEAAPRFAALMDEHLTAATTLKDALLSHGESLVGAGQRFAETEAAIAGGLPVVSS